MIMCSWPSLLLNIICWANKAGLGQVIVTVNPKHQRKRAHAGMPILPD